MPSLSASDHKAPRNSPARWRSPNYSRGRSGGAFDRVYRDPLRLEGEDGETDRQAEIDSGDGGAPRPVNREGRIAPMATQAMAGTAKALTFTAEDDGYEAGKKWLVRRGVEIDREAKGIRGGRSLWVRDPDGRRIEFKTAAVVKAPSRPPMPIARKPD